VSTVRTLASQNDIPPDENHRFRVWQDSIYLSFLQRVRIARNADRCTS